MGRREIEISVSGRRLDGEFLLRLKSCGIQDFRWYTANDGERQRRTLILFSSLSPHSMRRPSQCGAEMSNISLTLLYLPF